MSILSIVGTRPNFVKMAPIIKEIEKRGLDHVLVHTGQHYDLELSNIFLEELDLPKLDHYLDVGSGSHCYQIGKILIKLEKVLFDEKPEFVMVPGDTNTSLAGALGASKIDTILCHIESGLRSFDKTMPEENNRILIDHCSDHLFCPTKTAVDNLTKEGIGDKALLVGDTMMDACLTHLKLAKEKGFERTIGIEGDYYLATVHRAENTDNGKRLKGIFNAFLQSDTTVVFPAHPRTRKVLEEYGLLETVENSETVKMIEPVGYLEFLYLLSEAKLMLTDSGGVQKEAFFLKIPCVTLRDNTEWVETLECGCNTLVGADTTAIMDGIEKMKDVKIEDLDSPFGDGKAGQKIVDFVVETMH
jgi:UDP-N-acetylglucosamine 2-epimerase (non-hydrolysing)